MDVPRIGVPRIGVPRIGVPRIGVPGIDVARIGVARIDAARTGVARIDAARTDVARIGIPKIVGKMYQKSLLKTVTSLKTTKKIFGKPKDVRGNGRRENAKRKESLKNVKKLVTLTNWMVMM